MGTLEVTGLDQSHPQKELGCFLRWVGSCGRKVTELGDTVRLSLERTLLVIARKMEAVMGTEEDHGSELGMLLGMARESPEILERTPQMVFTILCF